MVNRPDSGKSVCTTCPYCGVGCGVLADATDPWKVTISGDPDHPANGGRLCSKGAALGETLGLEGRLLKPQLAGRPLGWDDALDLVAARFSQTVRDHGPDSVAFYVSGQILTEDYYVANKLMKGFIGSANIDTNSRLCMASSVAGHKRAFGADTVPGQYSDLEEADLVILTGTNLAWCHPVLFQRLEAARQARPEMKLVVIDPRRSPTAEAADLHLPIRADGDVALFSGLARHLITEGATDQAYLEAHTQGLNDLEAALEVWTEEKVLADCGLDPQQLAEFYRLFTATERVVTVYSQGVNQSTSGTDKVNAILNCHLITGRIGRPGMGPFSVTGQPNAMGGREVGGLANQLAAHLELANPDHRQTVQDFWQSPVIADHDGLKAVELFDALAEGRIKALWVMGTNPAVSLPKADAVRDALDACDFLVVSDVTAETDTAQLADLLLPAAAWGEKDGTVTNSERCISRQRGFLPLPGEVRPDWWIISEVGRRMGFGEAFDFASPADVFREHAALSAVAARHGRDFDLSGLAGLSDAGYDQLTPGTWPRPAAGDGQARFFADGGFFTPDGRAHLLPPPPPADKPAALGLTLNSGRIRDQWHTMTRTGLTARLWAHLAEPFVAIHPSDAAEIGVEEAGLADLTQPDGCHARLRVLVTDAQPRGAVFVPMHWTGQFSGAGRINALVSDARDPVSGQPALKMSTVSIAPTKPALYGFAVSRHKPQTDDLDYWALARTDGGWRLEFAIDTSRNFNPDQINGMLSREANTTRLSYHDNGGARLRFAAFKDDQLDWAAYLGGRPVEVSRTWLAGQLAEAHPDNSARLRLLAGRPGGDQQDCGALVCSCFGVGSRQILAAARRSGCRTVQDIGDVLSAGSNCGSCRVEIARLLKEVEKADQEGLKEQTAALD